VSSLPKIPAEPAETTSSNASAERRNLADALAHERNVLRTMIDLIPAFIYAKDAGSRFIAMNTALARNMGTTHIYASVDMRLTRKFRFGERMSLDLIAEGFNLFNRFNEAAANPFYTAVNAFNERSGGKYYSFPTASFDPRQFQLGFKFNF